MAEFRVSYADKGRPVVATGADGATAVEVRRAEGITELHTHSGVWRLEKAGDHTTAVRDPQGAAVAVIHWGHLGHHTVELPDGEEVRCRPSRRLGHGYVVGELAHAKAPFVAPQRHFTLTTTDALMARPDRDLLLALATLLSESAISMSIAVSVTS